MPPVQPLKIGIVGAGAIGSALAGRLALAGQPTALVARGARRDCLIKDGIRLREAGGTVQTAHPDIIGPEDVGALDVVILAVKAHALPDLLPRLAAVMAPSAQLVPAVNGVPWWYFQGLDRFADTSLASIDPGGAMLRLFAADRVVGCVVYTRASMADDGEVTVQGQQSLRIGTIAPGPAPAAIGGQLASAGISISLEDNVRREVWRKLLRNASTNLVSGLTGTTLEQISRDPGLLEVASGIAAEVIGLAVKLDCPIGPDLDGFVEELGRAGPHIPSTLQDIRAGREPELAALAEAPLEVARLVGHDMPILRRLRSLLQAKLRYAA